MDFEYVVGKLFDVVELLPALPPIALGTQVDGGLVPLEVCRVFEVLFAGAAGEPLCRWSGR